MRRIVALHGFTGAPESWDAVRSALAPGVGMICPPLVGHDPGDAIRSPTFEAEVDRLAGHAAGGVELAGYSQGGRLAVGLLVRHRRRFAAATLIGASPGLGSEAERRARRDADQKLARRLEQEGIESFLDDWEKLPLFASQHHLPVAVLARQRTIRRRHRPEALARALRVLGLGRMPDYWPHLAELDLPVRLLVGELDAKFRCIAERMAELLPHGHLEVVPGVGHNLLLEAPERVAAALCR
ncbi:MAG: alpha/beta fold hydrolase [bacterium]|nr:alpha/beta fold hydrolase [bacterium]